MGWGAMSEAVMLFLVLGNSFALLVFGIGLLLIKDKKPVHYAGIVLATTGALTLLIATANFLGLGTQYPLLDGLEYAVVPFFGPAAYLMFSLLSGENFTKKRVVAVFVPAVALAGFVILTKVLPIKAVVAAKGLYTAGKVAAICLVLFFLTLFLVCAARRHRRSTEPRFDKSLVFFAGLDGLILVVVGLNVISLLAHSRAFNFITAVAVSFLGLVGIFACFRYPARFNLGFGLSVPTGDAAGVSAAGGLAGQGRYRKSKIANLDVTAAVTRINAVMEKEKPYLDDGFTLASLAKRLGLSTHQLSEILNTVMNTSFAGLARRYRLREAMRILRDDPERPVLEIAFDCGFGSKSTFNQIFAQETGMTPSEWRKREIGGATE
jgi:AraC-like DNA-binding protein